MTFKRVRLFWNGRSGDFHTVNIVKSVCLECCLISSHAFVCFPHPQSSATPKLAWQGTGKSSPTHTRSQGRLGQEEGKNELNPLERSCRTERFSDEFDPAPTRDGAMGEGEIRNRGHADQRWRCTLQTDHWGQFGGPWSSSKVATGSGIVEQSRWNCSRCRCK